MASGSGSVQFGNFVNYYYFNSVEKRLKLLPVNILDLFPNEDHVVVLDVGCNAGDLTVGIYRHMIQTKNDKPQLHILAIDLDPSLISKCQQSNLYPENIEYIIMNIMDSSEYGDVFTNYLKKYNKTKFDMVLCFSVTMWIHLNYGDDGLKTFLKNICDMSNYLLLEPQNWKCYMSASRRMRRLKCDIFQDFKKLSITRATVDDIEDFLQTDCHVKRIALYGFTNWKRHISLYKCVSVAEIHVKWQYV